MANRKMSRMEKYRLCYAVDEFLQMRDNIMYRRPQTHWNDGVCRNINIVALKYVDDINIVDLKLDKEDGIFVQTAKVKDYVTKINNVFGESFNVKELDNVMVFDEYSYNRMRAGYEQQGMFRKMMDTVFKDEKPYYKRDAIYGFDKNSCPFAVARQGESWYKLQFIESKETKELRCVAFEPLQKENIFTGEVRPRFDKFNVLVNDTMMETMQKCTQAFLDLKHTVDLSKPVENKEENHHFISSVTVLDIHDTKQNMLVTYEDWNGVSNLWMPKVHTEKADKPLTMYDKFLCYANQQVRNIPEGFPLKNVLEGFINTERANEKMGGEQSVMYEQLSKPLKYLYARLIDDNQEVTDSAIRLGTASSKRMNQVIGMDDAQILTTVFSDRERFKDKLDIFVQSDELSAKGKVIIGLGASAINVISRAGSYKEIQREMGAVDKLSRTVMRNSRAKKTEATKKKDDFER